MTIFSGQIAQSTDDGDQTSTGAVNLTNATTILKNSTSPNKTYWAGRIENVTVSGGATVSAASLSIYDPSGGGTGMDATLYGNKVANPGTLATTSSYLSGLVSTTNTAAWNSTLTTSAFNSSPDITSVVNELIGQSGWASGNAMLFVLHAQSSSLTATIENYDGSPSEAAEISITYTSGSPPGAPTGLTATWQGGGSVLLSWTEPAGSPFNDTLIQYSTDDATWTTIDTGSGSITGYTVTGLATNTLYYFQVAVTNNSGTGTYSYYAYAYTGAVVSVTTGLAPVSDSLTTGWTNNGGAASFSGGLTDGSDATYAVPSANTGQYLELALATPPTNLIAVTSVTINMRAKTTSGSDTNSVGFIVRTSAGSLLLAGSTQVTSALTTSFANYVTPSAYASSGPQALANWTGAILRLLPTDVNQDNQIAEVSVTLAYWIAAPPFPAPIGAPLGTGACPYGVTNHMRRNRVEGVRLQHQNG